MTDFPELSARERIEPLLATRISQLADTDTFDAQGRARQRLDQFAAEARKPVEAELAELQRRYEDEHATAVERAHETERVRKQLADAKAELAALHAGEEPYEDENAAPTPAQWIWHWNRARPDERLSMAANRVDLLERFHRCLNGHHEARLAEYWEYFMAAKVRAEAAEAERDQFAAAVPLVCSDERHQAKVRGLEALLVAGQKAATHWEEAYAREVAAHGVTERALSAAEARIAAVRALADDLATWQATDGVTAASVRASLIAALDGPTEQPADGPKQGPTVPVSAEDFADRQLVARYVPVVLPACPDCGQRVHGGYSCAEFADTVRRNAEALDRVLNLDTTLGLPASMTGRLMVQKVGILREPSEQEVRARVRDIIAPAFPATAPQFAPTAMPEPVQPPTWSAMAELAERARAEFLAEQLRLERAITTAIEGAGLTIVRAEPAEQVAAHPAAIHRLRTEVFHRGLPSGLPGQIGRLDGLPVIPDGSLPPGEVHLRPHPRPADGAS